MAALTINGEPVPVRADELQVDDDLNKVTSRAIDESLLSETFGPTIARRRIQVPLTGYLSTTRGHELETLMTAPGYVTAGGDVLGESVACKASNVNRFDGPPAGKCRLSFDLHEVGG